MTDDALSNLLHEDRRFPPLEDIAANANVTAETYAEAEADFDGFWAEQAERLSWQTKPTQVLDWSNPPFAKWFADGTLNAAYNCLDRDVEAATAIALPSILRASQETLGRSRTPNSPKR